MGGLPIKIIFRLRHKQNSGKNERVGDPDQEFSNVPVSIMLLSYQLCFSHNLCLIVKDIFGATKTRKSGSDVMTYPLSYTLGYMLEFVRVFKDVFKLFHNRHFIKAQLQESQKTTGVKYFATAVPTRWGKSNKCKVTSSLLNFNVIELSLYEIY